MNYFDLSIDQKINCKGNARILYTGYNQKWISGFEGAETILILKRISRRDAEIFTPNMLLNKNTVRI